MDWIELARDRDEGVGTCECGNEPSGSIKFAEYLDHSELVSFTRRCLLHVVSKMDMNSRRRTFVQDSIHVQNFVLLHL